ncbi:MAG: tRNA 2-thiouridine(34) synthase MnmA [Chloroflexi bacterium]|nr:tRNA 2-thiouridine(34) synthase MnmA [Chloroflexota bacterium]
MTPARRVVVAMSGGVDSSVAAALLKEQGYQVIGMMLRLWSEAGKEDSNRCCTPDAMAQARRVAALLEIPFYAVDAQQAFYQAVVQPFVDGYTQGVTPNPCLACNRQVRWSYLLDHALALGADFLATGHYARLERDAEGGLHLLRAVDHSKDQSYVLHVLTQPKLARALFPLGDYTKPQARDLARRFGLPVAERSDSQDLCFLAGGELKGFLLRHAPQTASPGPIASRDGRIFGEHHGLAFYTIGQRKGLGLAAPRPLYVLAKDLQRNTLIVGEAHELGSRELTTGRVHWIAGAPPPLPLRAQVKTRYTAQEAWAELQPAGEGRVHAVFEQTLRDITPGQTAVFYQEERCLGGGVILTEQEASS